MKKLNLVNASYTFADYFKLNPYIDDLVEYFGYRFERRGYELPRALSCSFEQLPMLLKLWEKTLNYISLNNETAKREFLIAPLLMELIQLTQAKLKTEFPLMVNDKLKGSLDYFIQGKHGFLVIEAKNGDLEQGFVQLAVELIALDQWIEEPDALLYGAVSVGSVWQFGILQRQDKLVIQDTHLFRVPADVEDLLRVMIAIVTE